jgi:hypothetical protein
LFTVHRVSDVVPAKTGSANHTWSPRIGLLTVVAVPVLFPGTGSVLAEAAVAVVIVAPFAVFALTFTTIVNVAITPATDVAREHHVARSANGALRLSLTRSLYRGYKRRVNSTASISVTVHEHRSPDV